MSLEKAARKGEESGRKHAASGAALTYENGIHHAKKAGFLSEDKINAFADGFVSAGKGRSASPSTAKSGRRASAPPSALPGEARGNPFEVGRLDALKMTEAQADIAFHEQRYPKKLFRAKALYPHSEEDRIAYETGFERGTTEALSGGPSRGPRYDHKTRSDQAKRDAASIPDSELLHPRDLSPYLHVPREGEGMSTYLASLNRALWMRLKRLEQAGKVKLKRPGLAPRDSYRAHMGSSLPARPEDFLANGGRRRTRKHARRAKRSLRQQGACKSKRSPRYDASCGIVPGGAHDRLNQHIAGSRDGNIRDMRFFDAHWAARGGHARKESHISPVALTKGQHAYMDRAFYTPALIGESRDQARRTSSQLRANKRRARLTFRKKR